jgi:hypothetical protein
MTRRRTMRTKEALEFIADSADAVVANVVYNDSSEVCTLVKGNGMQTLTLLAEMIKAMAKDKDIDPRFIILMLSGLVKEDNDETASDDSEGKGGSAH